LESAKIEVTPVLETSPRSGLTLLVSLPK
jgi:hypothetical protein